MRCYILTACAGTAVDRDTNNVTMFNMMEEALLPAPFVAGALVGIQTLVGLQAGPGELGREVDVRLVWCKVDAGDEPSVVHRIQVTHPRVRIRAALLKLPTTPGQYDLRLEWKWAGEEEQWHREAATWPLLLSVQPDPPLAG
jgi:hypothetical protein